MDKFLVWYENGQTKHFDIVEEVLEEVRRNKEVTTVTVELYDGDKYLGEVDYSVEDFLSYIED